MFLASSRHRAVFGDAFPSTAPEFTTVNFLGPDGRITGNSNRPELVIDSVNYSEVAAWYRQNGVTTRVGLFEAPEFILSPDAVGQVNPFSRASYVLGLGQGDGAFGISARYSPVWLYPDTRPPLGYSRRYERGHSGWIYFNGVTSQVGLTDLEHTAFDGARFSTPTALNAAGQAIGTSARFAEGLPINTTSNSTWFFNGTTTVRTGLTAGDHTAGDNYHLSENIALNARGDVVGHTQRYASSVAVDLGRSAWLHRDGQTFDLSLTDFGFAKTILDGESERTYRFSTLVALNDAGHVLGTAQRFAGSGADAGQAVWWFGTSIRSSTVDISPVGAGFERADGYRFAAPSWLNDNGEVVGTASRYLGSADGGRSAWLYSPENGTLDISPTDEGFVRADGYRFATPLARTDLGHTIGSATRYSGASENGQAVWRYDGVETADIGLDTPEVVGPGGARSDTFVAAIVGGKVLGYSARTDGGREAWLHDPNRPGREPSTQAIGLSGTGRTQTIVAHTPSGQVAGHADRPDGGREAWRYDGSVTTDIGMGGGEFETAAGLRFSTTQFMNSRGDILGLASTYEETGLQAGTALWFNDGDSTRVVVSGVTPDRTGYSYRAHQLTESGLVIGFRDLDTYSNVFIWDSAAATGQELSHITLGLLPGTRRLNSDVRFVSDQHGLVIGEYVKHDTPFQPKGFYVWARGLGAFDLDSLVGTELFNETGISSLSYFVGEFNGLYSFFETDEGVVMTIEQDERAGGIRTYQLNISLAVIPEPASFAMLAGAAALGLAALRRRPRHRA